MDTDVIVAIIGSITTVGGIFITHFLTKKKSYDRRQPMSDGRIKLSRHDLFRRMDYWITYLETSFKLDDTGKSAVFREMLINKFSIWRDELYNLAVEVEGCIEKCKDENCIQLATMNMNHFREAHVKTVNFYKYSEQYTDDEKEALKRVADKFNTWHHHRINYMTDEIERKSNSKMHSDCYVRQVAIFDSYVGAFADTIFDAERTLNMLNGDLNGLVFRGKTIQSKHH